MIVFFFYSLLIAKYKKYGVIFFCCNEIDVGSCLITLRDQLLEKYSGISSWFFLNCQTWVLDRTFRGSMSAKNKSIYIYLYNFSCNKIFTETQNNDKETLNRKKPWAGPDWEGRGANATVTLILTQTFFDLFVIYILEKWDILTKIFSKPKHLCWMHWL